MTKALDDLTDKISALETVALSAITLIKELSALVAEAGQTPPVTVPVSGGDSAEDIAARSARIAAITKQIGDLVASTKPGTTPAPSDPTPAPSPAPSGERKIRMASGLNQMAIDRSQAGSQAQTGWATRHPVQLGIGGSYVLRPVFCNNFVASRGNPLDPNERGSLVTWRAYLENADGTKRIQTKFKDGSTFAQVASGKTCDDAIGWTPDMFGPYVKFPEETWFLVDRCEVEKAGDFHSCSLHIRDYTGFSSCTYDRTTLAADAFSRPGPLAIAGSKIVDRGKVVASQLVGERDASTIAIGYVGDSWMRDTDSEGEGNFFPKRLYADISERSAYDEATDKVYAYSNLSFYGTQLGNDYSGDKDARRPFYKYLDKVVCGLGYNVGTDSNLPGMQKNYLDFYAVLRAENPNVEIYQMLIIGKDLTTSDQYRTPEGQTVGKSSQPGGLQYEFNKWVRTLVGTVITGVIENKDIQDPATPYKVRTNGTPYWLLDDSNHPTRGADNGIAKIAKEIRRVILGNTKPPVQSLAGESIPDLDAPVAENIPAA